MAECVGGDFSKLPVRQVTPVQISIAFFHISKLPVRQVTYPCVFNGRLSFSKLPVRQVTTGRGKAG